MKQKVSTAVLIVESAPENMSRSEVFSWQEMLASIQRVRNANIALIIFDEHGVPIRSATVGNPSDRMKEIIAAESVPEDMGAVSA